MQAALKLLVALCLVALPRAAAAEDCTRASPCVDAEPLWLTPAARRFALVSDTAPAPFGDVSGSATFGFRWRPAVVVVPSPSRDGREVNALRHATDATLGLRGGIGNGLELTLVLPAGLYQRGAGIKGVTHQSASAIPAQSLHDPRLGFGFALPTTSASYGAKLRLELKLPLGDGAALSGEQSVVVSPSLALAGQRGGWFAGAELGARLRTPSDVLGSRVGAQALFALGAGYALERPRLTFATEACAAPSLVASGTTSYVPAEWLASASFSPRALPRLAVGLGGGTGLPVSSDDAGGFLGLGVPLFRAVVFARWAPKAP